MLFKGLVAYEPITIPLIMPPKRLGMPCKLIIPHVSYNPMDFYSFGCKYLWLIIQAKPAKAPMVRDPAGFIIKPLDAPIITPPAKVAARISCIKNFYLRKDVVIKAPKQLPVNETIVFIIITLF